MTLKESYQKNFESYVKGDTAPTDISASLYFEDIVDCIRLANDYYTAIGIAEGDVYNKDKVRTSITKMMLSSRNKIAYEGIQKAYGDLAEKSNYFSNLGFQLTLAEHKCLVFGSDVDSTIKMCYLNVTLANTVAFIITAINEVVKLYGNKTLSNSSQELMTTKARIQNGFEELKEEWKDNKDNLLSLKDDVLKSTVRGQIEKVHTELRNLWSVQVFQKTITHDNSIELFLTTRAVLMDLLSILGNLFN